MDLNVDSVRLAHYCKHNDLAVVRMILLCGGVGDANQSIGGRHKAFFLLEKTHSIELIVFERPR